MPDGILRSGSRVLLLLAVRAKCASDSDNRRPTRSRHCGINRNSLRADVEVPCPRLAYQQAAFSLVLLAIQDCRGGKAGRIQTVLRRLGPPATMLGSSGGVHGRFRSISPAEGLQDEPTVPWADRKASQCG